MVPVILQLFDAQLVDEEGNGYTARACGRERPDGIWEGWIEFEREDGVVLRTERETTQPSYAEIVYWASGVEPTYLEGAFDRACEVGVEPMRHTHLRSPGIA